MNFGTFSRANRDRCESQEGFGHALASWSLSDWMTATLGELGEAANIVKKLNRVRDGVPGNVEGTDALTVHLRHEIADTFIYLDLLAQAAGFDLEDAVREKFDDKSMQIGYPHPLPCDPDDPIGDVRRAITQAFQEWEPHADIKRLVDRTVDLLPDWIRELPAF